MTTYECEINTRKGPVVFWAKAGQYLWVDLGNGGSQACVGGYSGSGRAISVGSEYTDLSDDRFKAICRRWLRQRARRIRT